MTKTVPVEWYKRYCHVLPDEEKVFTQPRRDFITDRNLLRNMKQMESDGVVAVEPAVALAQFLDEERQVKKAAIADIANGNFERASKKFQTLKNKNQAPLEIVETNKQRKRKPVAALKLRCVAPLKKNSKWKLLTQNKAVVLKLKDMKADRRRQNLVYKFRRAVRIIRTVLRFGTIIADISRATSEVFKEFNESLARDRAARKVSLGRGICFDKTLYESSFLHREKIDEASVHTLRNLEFLRTNEAISHVATVLSQNCKSFRVFPAHLQLAMARVGWYADVSKDRVIIREGQEPNNFYFVLSGKTIAVKLKGSPLQERAGRFDIVREYGPNDVFGHEDLYDCRHRNYSVVCTDDSVLISVSYVDYLRVSALPPSGQQNPDYLKFLSRLSFMRYFPLLKLIRDSGDGNIFCFYFNPGVVITKKVRRSDYIFVIKNGECTVCADVTTLNPYKQSILEKPLRKVFTTNHSEKPRRKVSSTASDFSAYPVLPAIRNDNNNNQSAESTSLNSNEDESTRRESMLSAKMRPIAPARRRNCVSKKQTPNSQVVLKKLIEGEVIGIEHVDLGDDVDQCDVRVVSGGCEVGGRGGEGGG